ncbi:RDD family protein [Polynucleobacter sp.]|uniref:RDD family protein n=1 Tax=Polynucleobacter sp. TaxID=2029855 RepID=UPI003F695B79
MNDLNTNIDQLSLTIAKPWRRFFARNFDLYLEIMLLSIFAQFTLAKYSTWYVNLINTPNNDIVIAIIFTPFALLLDAIICQLFGNSLGKYLLGIEVRKIKGQLSLQDWINRSGGVWFNGYALGFPLFNIYTFLKQKGRIDKGQPTTYDERGGFQVFARELTKFQIVRAVILFSLVYFLVFGMQVYTKEQDRAVQKIDNSPPYTWQNPVTGIEISVSPIWKYLTAKNGDGQPYWQFTETTDHAAIVLGIETGIIDMSTYVDLFRKSVSSTMQFNDGGRFFELNGFQVWEAYGAMSGVDGRLKVQVRQIGNNFWRVVTIQTKPYEFSDQKVSALELMLWKSIQPM